MDFLREISSKKNHFTRRDESTLMQKLNYVKPVCINDIDTDLEDGVKDGDVAALISTGAGSNY